jgi:hypothetical protein
MSRKMRWAGNVARMGEKKNAYRILWESQKERDHWEDQNVFLFPVPNSSVLKVNAYY